MRAVVGIKNLDGIPTCTVGVDVPDDASPEQIREVARLRFQRMGYNVPNTDRLGIVRTFR